MSTTIWKFNLSNKEDDFIEIPAYHKILSVGEQDHMIMLWASVDTSTPIVKKRITIVGTGWEGSPIMNGIMTKKFIGTIQMKNGLVFHVFE